MNEISVKKSPYGDIGVVESQYQPMKGERSTANEVTSEAPKKKKKKYEINYTEITIQEPLGEGVCSL